jgi:hypothetical protein
MELAVATFLIAIVVLGTVALAIAVPFSLGLMAYDLIKSKASEAPASAGARNHIAAKRGVARAFVIVGSLFWSVAAFAEFYTTRQVGFGEAALAAIVPLGASLVTLVIGWYWERLTAVALMAASIAVVAAGVIYQYSPQAWAVMTFALIGPMVTAAVLFWAARREQEAYERATSLRPDLAFAFAARSTLD